MNIDIVYIIFKTCLLCFC